MCLITVIPKGIEKYSAHIEECIESGVSGNGDGSGIAFLRPDSPYVFIQKNFLGANTVENFMKAYRSFNLKKEDEVIIHHRWGTSGPNDENNTHPYALTTDLKTMTQPLHSTDKGAMAHNGVLSESMIGYNNPAYSDTARFLYKKIMTEQDADGKTGYDLLLKGVQDLSTIINNMSLTSDFMRTKLEGIPFYKKFEEAIIGERLAFLIPKIGLVLFGEYVKDNENILHSNHGYMHYNNSYSLYDEELDSFCCSISEPQGAYIPCGWCDQYLPINHPWEMIYESRICRECSVSYGAQFGLEPGLGGREKYFPAVSNDDWRERNVTTYPRTTTIAVENSIFEFNMDTPLNIVAPIPIESTISNEGLTPFLFCLMERYPETIYWDLVLVPIDSALRTFMDIPTSHGGQQHYYIEANDNFYKFTAGVDFDEPEITLAVYSAENITTEYVTFYRKDVFKYFTFDVGSLHKEMYTDLLTLCAIVGCRNKKLLRYIHKNFDKFNMHILDWKSVHINQVKQSINIKSLLLYYNLFYDEDDITYLEDVRELAMEWKSLKRLEIAY